MNRKEFNEAIRALNPNVEDPAAGLIRLAASRDDLTGLPYNFVPVGGGLHEILVPGDRGGFSHMETSDYSKPFIGTLDEAYQRVFDERRRMREQRLAALADARSRDEDAGSRSERDGTRMELAADNDD
ncbi:hypothetical protein [Microbacterium sp. SORGH_AS_0888]|uniref:hypothetical protein n=1 Tax=Microbacterium sp. SORGH_AS_0888 TaxID=3041791 RepID=UPI00278ADF01|nr:hypothetical protein [Microbacterium sp. SORGH_AS_0888]MDQ1130446.1 hypothetical protein [Microbacterium sp. SORGH_AS_0888]